MGLGSEQLAARRFQAGTRCIEGSRSDEVLLSQALAGLELALGLLHLGLGRRHARAAFGNPVAQLFHVNLTERLAGFDPTALLNAQIQQRTG